MIYDQIKNSPKDKKQSSNNVIDQTNNNTTQNGTKILNLPSNLNQKAEMTSNQQIHKDNYPKRQELFDDSNNDSNNQQVDTKFANQRYNSVERKDKQQANGNDYDGINNQNQHIKEQNTQKSTQRSNIQGVHQDIRQETYEQANSNKDLELEKTNRSQSKFMESNGFDSNRNKASSNQFNRIASNNNIQTNRNQEDSQNEENVNTGRSKNTENFSSKLEVELKKLSKGKKKQSKRDSLGLSAQEKALIEKMKLNTNQRNSQKSPLSNLIGRQIYEDQIGKTTKNNRDEQNATPQKHYSKIRYSNNSITPIQMGSSPGQNDSQRIVVQKTLNKRSFVLEDSQISEQDKSLKQEIRNLRSRLNSRQQTSQDSQSDMSGSDKERSQDKNYIYNEQDEIEEEQNAGGVQGKMYQKVRDLLQQQLDEDGGYLNQEEEEDELNQEKEMIKPEDFIDQATMEEYEKLTLEQELRTQNQYLKTYKVQKKSALDKLQYLFYKPSILLKIFKFFFLLKCAISDFCYKIIKSSWFENLVLLIIIFNSIMLMLDDPTTDVQSSFADWCEQFFLWAYTVEACLKIIALGFILPKGAYLRDGWNILDFTIVVSSLLPLVIGSSTVNLRALRSLRILRPLRTISKVKKLKILLKTLFSAIPYLVNSMIILTFFFLIFAIGGLQLFSGLLLRRCLDPLTGIVIDYNQVCGGGYQCDGINICGKTMSNPQFNVTNFDDIFYSFLMVFQVITMEGWSQIMYQLFDAFSIFTVIYFVLLIFIGSFFLINLTLAVIKAKFSDNQGTTIVEQEQEEEPEMSIDILREYRSLERHYLKTVDPMNSLLIKQRERLHIENFREEQQKRGFVWEDLAKLRMLQKQKQKENILKEERLRKKLFVEQWRNKQKSKIQQATKKIAKFYRIIPQFQLLSSVSIQNNHEELQALPAFQQSNVEESNNQDLQNHKLIEQNATLFQNQTNNKNHFYASKNKIVPFEHINLNGLALSHQNSQNIPENDQRSVVPYPNQNQNKNSVTFMGFQTNYFGAQQRPLLLVSQQSKSQQQLYSSNSSQQMLLNDEEEENFWKQIEGQKNLSTNKDIQKDNQSKTSHKESDKQQTSSASSQTNIQEKQNNNSKTKSRDDFFAQPSQEQLQQEVTPDKQLQDYVGKSVLNKTDSTRSRESVFDHSSPKKFSILNLKSSKKQSSQFTKQKSDKPEVNFKKFSISSQGSIMLESHSSIIEFQDQELNKQNSDSPLKLNLVSTEGDDMQFTSRINSVKSHINPNHNITSPIHQNLINFNSPSNDPQNDQLQKQETKDMNDSLLNDSDFYQDPEKKQEQNENYEYLAQVLKNLNEKIANKLKNESDEDNNSDDEDRNDDFEDGDANQEDDFNLQRRNKVRRSTFKNNKKTFQKKPDQSQIESKNKNIEQSNRKVSDQDQFNKIIHEVEEEEDDEQKTNKNTERVNKQQKEDEQISPSNQQSSQKQKNVQQENGETQLNESSSQHQENNKEEKNQNDNHNNQNKPAFEISEYQKQREKLQIEWLKKIEKIRQEHKLIGASSSSQFFQLEMMEKRKKEKEEQDLKERMIKEVKYWKLMVDYKHENDFTSKEDVMEQTINLQIRNLEEEEQQRLKQLKYRILHKLKVVKKKKKLTKRQRKRQNLSKSFQNAKKSSNDNSVKENSPNPNASSIRAKERILKLKRLQQMISNAAMSKKSGQNQNSILQADNSGIRRKNDSNTIKDFKDNKSVITFSKFAGFQSPQNSVKGDNIKGKFSQSALQKYNKSFTSTNSLGSIQDDVHRLKIPIKMSNRILFFDQFSSHQGDDLSISEAQSASVSNQNNNQSNSLTVRNTKFIISQTKKKRERIKKELLQEQNVKNNEKINYSNYSQVVHAINAPIKKSKNEHNDIQDNFDFKNEYLDQLREDALTGVKTKQIFSGIDVLRGYRGGAIRLNQVLRPLNSDRQEIKMWIPGILGMLIVIHKHINHFVKSSFFNNLATLAVFANTVVLALAGSFSDDQSNQILDQLNNFFTFVFIGEMAFKVIGLTPAGYVRDRMNIFDGFIVCLSILELVIFSGSGSKAFSAFRSVRIFRTFRVLRVTRLLRGLEFMGVIIKVISRTLDSFIYIAFLLFLFIFIFTLLGMQIYGGKLETIDPRVRQNFDSFQNGFITVFQLMTIENWNDILYKTLNSSVNKFLTSFYLIIWIFIGNWIFLNLFLAILLDGFTDQSQEDSLELEDEDQYEEEVADKNENKNQQFNQLNQENLQILNEDFERMDSEEMELLEQEILQLEGKSQNQQLFIGIECSHSLYLFSKQNSIRILFYKIVKHPQFENLILFFIVTSSFKLVVDTYVDDSSDAGAALKNIDLMFNFIFITEALLKIIAYGFIGDENSYLDESWSQIDFFIVCTSIIDMTFSGVNVSFVKILRLLRTLRPLRFISHNVNMKVVVIALFESISGIFNILIVIFLIWIMFAILGISLIGNRMGYCSGITYIYHVNQDRCLSMGYSWQTYDTNFDNILNAMRTLYIISSLEGWPDLMYQAIDSNTADVGPVKDNYIQISYFYMIFILVGSFFLINLFVGVIFLNFNEAQKNEKQSSLFLTEEQKRWIEFQQMIIGVKAEFAQSVVPTQKLPRLMYNIVTNQKFEIFIMILIVANILTMAMAYEGSPSSYDSVLEYINLFFTSCFILETIMKFIAFGIKGFFANDWNKFDLFVVISSIVDIILNYSGALSASFLRIGPQLIRIIRVFRVSRLLKLVKSMKGLQKLIETLMFSLPSLINVGALLFLVFFIYSILGVFMFKDVTEGVVIDKYNNFENFGNAMITLFRCSTGENWYQFMFDCGKTSGCVQGKDCGSPFSTLFFISFVLICSFIMLNLFILIIIQYFEDYHMKEDNPLQAFNDKLNIFRITWSKYTKKTLGEKINSKDIVDFLYDLPLPLGYHDPDPNAATAHPVTKKEIAKQVMNWALIQQVGDDQQEYVFFNDMLFACMKKEYGSKLMQNAGPELMRMLNKLEVETRLKIAEKKKKQILKKNKKVFGGNHQKGQKKANPMIAFMFLQMSFKAWSNYSKVKIANGKPDGEQEENSNSSSSEESYSSEEEQFNDNQENQTNEEAQNNKQDIKDEEIERQSFQSASRKKSEVVLRDKLSRKGTYISKANSQNKYDLKNDLNKNKQQKSSLSSSSPSSSSNQSSNSDSNSSDDDDSSNSSSHPRPNSKEKKSQTHSKVFDKQVSKKGNKSIIFDQISEKADKEEWSPNQKKNQSSRILRRIDTLNLKKLDTDFEFGQTNKYQYSANQNQNKLVNLNKIQINKQGNASIEMLSKNSIFNQKNRPTADQNKLLKQASLKNYI